MAHYSKADQQVWNEFNQRWDALVEESQKLAEGNSLDALFAGEPEAGAMRPLSSDISFPTGPTTQARMVMTRLKQSFFRRTVLASYQNACCLCGLDFPQLLIASHIKPWGSSEETRIDPENGLCLCVLHDKAYDRGLLSVTAAYEVVISPVVKKSKAKFTALTLTDFDKRPIRMPSRFAPKPQYLQWHLDTVLQRA